MEWTTLTEFPDYEITRTGQIRHKHDKRELNPHTCSEGYFAVNLQKDCKKYVRRIHRLLAQTFLPNPLRMPVVDHINQNKKYNNFENLRWTTKSENAINARARVTNTGHQYIYEHPRGFQVEITREYISMRVFCKTLEEAVAKKEEFLEQIKTHHTV